MIDFATSLAASRRLATLRVLEENEGSANESVMRTALGALGFRGRQATDEGLKDDLRALVAAELIVLEDYLGKVTIATITKKGVKYLHRQVEPIEGIEYPSLGV